MERNEVRYGNRVIYGGQETTIDEKEIIHFFRFPEKYEAILLTEEWLLRFGFQKIVFDSEETGYGIEYQLKVNSGIFFNYADDFSLEIDENEESINNSLSILPKWELIDKVHGLQNLYFALTGEELTIKK